MSEPTLSLTYSDLLARVGVFAGWGRGADFGEDAWDDRKAAQLADAVQSGLRRFYYPEVIQGESTAYDWSFLHPVSSLAFAIGASTVPLPDDFGGFEGPITITATAATAQPWTIEWKNEGQIRELYSLTPEMTGPPMYAAERPLKGTTATEGQRHELLIFPLADQAYTLAASYYLNPDCLSGSFPYAYGGPEHIETILESCLAVFEERYDDTSTIHQVAFQRRLTASIAMDRKKKPQKIGYNLDRSDRRQDDRLNPHWWAPAATYNGGSFQ